MKSIDYFYNCSRDFLGSIHPGLYAEVVGIVSVLPKRSTQAEINKDLFWILASKRWSFSSVPPALEDSPPKGLCPPGLTKEDVCKNNSPSLCKSSTTIKAQWRVDFAKAFDGKLVQVEVQFGKVELMFKDFCGFRLAYYEKRLALGIMIVLHEPAKYFAHRRQSIGGMAYFDIAKNTLPAIGLDCPIWLVGITE